MSLRAISASLEAERAALVAGVESSFREMVGLVEQAFAAKGSGKISEARILLNEAIDIEVDVTGDAKVLGDLFEEWGGDYYRDQRRPDPNTPPRREIVVGSVWRHRRSAAIGERVVEALDHQLPGYLKVSGIGPGGYHPDTFRKEWEWVRDPEPPQPGKVALRSDGQCQRCGTEHMGSCRSTPRGFTADGECEICGCMHAVGPCPL